MRADTRVAAPLPEVPRAERAWRIRSCDDQAVRQLSAGLDVSPLIATLLSHRGVSDVGTGGAWLSASLRDLPDPMAMVAMTAAVDRIVAAIDSGDFSRVMSIAGTMAKHAAQDFKFRGLFPSIHQEAFALIEYPSFDTLID